MSDMAEETPAHARVTRKGWNASDILLTIVLTVLGLGIAVIAFIFIFGTVTRLLTPSMGLEGARAVPVCCEICFAFLFLNGVLLAKRRAPAGAFRGVAMAAIVAGSVILNVWSDRHIVPAIVGHVVLVLSFFTVMLASKETVMALRGGKVRADQLGLGEWLAHPLRSASLWRWMQTWGETSRERARARYMRLLYARAIAQADERVGRIPVLWMRRLPVTLRYQLSTGEMPVEASGQDWQERIREHVADQLSLLREARPEHAPGVVAAHAPGMPETGHEGRHEARPEPVTEHAPAEPGSEPGGRPGARPEPAPEHAPGPALKLAASKSRNMSPGELEPHVSAMLEAYGDVSQVRVKHDLHVSTDKAREALALARRNRPRSLDEARQKRA